MKKKSTKALVLLTFILIFSIVLISTIRKFTLATDINISSEIYNIKNNVITNISPNTQVNLYKKYFNLDNCYLKITNNNNEEITDGYIYTGSKTIVYNNNNTIINTYTNIIVGDVNADGLVNNDDLTKIQRYLNNEITLTEIEMNASDINNDEYITDFDINKLSEYLNSNYTSLSLNKEEIHLMTGEEERIIPTINPNIIKDQNLNWTSNNESVAMIDESGLIKAFEQGEAIITATTKNNSLSETVKVVVDNKPILEKTDLTTYTGAYASKLSIKSLNYNELTCSVTNESIASCQIENNKLIITPIEDGETKVKVISPTYGNSELNLKVLFTHFTVFPKAWCLKTRESVGGGIISGFNFGNLSVKSISDREIVVNSLINRNGLSVESGFKTGDAQIVFTESNGHKEVTFTAHVYKLNLSALTGTTPANGSELVSQISFDNTGNLSCTSNDSSIATCKIEENNLIITPISEGTTTIRLLGEKCGEIEYTANITRRLNEDNYLSNIKIEGVKLSPNFNKETLDYTATTEKSKVNIEAIKNNEISTISGDVGEKELSYGANLFKITIKSELGVERTYTITINRSLPKEEHNNETPKSTPSKDNNKKQTIKQKNNDASLKSLKIENYPINFNKDIFKYDITIKGTVNNLNIEAIANNSKSSVKIEKPKELVTGENIITIIVTSESGTKCKYIVVVNKQKLSTDTTINKIIVKNYKLNIKKNKYDYNLLINNESKLDINVILNAKSSTYKIKGNKKLKNGSIITITVTSEAKTTKDYKINIIKKEEGNSHIISNIPLTIIVASILIITTIITLIRKRILK